MIKRSCEDPHKIYLCLFGRRYIFEDGKYVGWYRPSLTRKNHQKDKHNNGEGKS